MPAPLTWDIFCRVVDNFGDAAVCWRLARQLADEHRARVRLWIDQPMVLHALCPEVAPAAPRQQVLGVELRPWPAGWPGDEPNDVVVEAFGCGLPEPYVRAMLARTPAPLWITLEYLSAEAWVTTHHALPSPHPRLGLERHFFFPGFAAGTGGLLRERGLAERRAMFGDPERVKFWTSYGYEPPAAESLVISLFAYADAPVGELLACWEGGDEPVVVVAPQGHMAERVRGHFGGPAEHAGGAMRRGALEARILPFLPQSLYDELLWSCHVNFVRGEDSFVRAQWAEHPFIWQAYPQAGGAHRLKLDAFLDTYVQGLDPRAGTALRTLSYQWNLMDEPPVNPADAWRDFRSHMKAIEAYAPKWARRIAEAGDLAGNLAQFACGRVK
jgi:uncharacterized repeat protein (TIGR03837 family)